MTSKIDKGWFYSSLLILFSTYAIPYVASLPAFCIIFICSFILIINEHLFTKKINIIWFSVLLFFSMLSFIHGQLEYYRCIYYLCWLSVCYIFIRKKGIAIFYYLEKTIYYFSLISILFYALEFLLGDSFYSMMRTFGSQLSSSMASREHRIAYNIIVYTTNAIPGEIPRNCGLYFEPGLHACYIVLSIILNYLRTKKLFTRQQNYLLVVLASTISTSGVLLYAMFMLVVTQRKNILLFFVVILLVFFVAFYMDIPFIHEKISKAFNQVGNYDELFAKSAAWNTDLHPDRLVSLQLGIIDLLKYPIWGTGKVSSSLGDFYGGEIIPSSGLAQLMMYYGSSILIIFLYMISKLSFKVSIFFRLPFMKWFLPLFIFLFSITYYIDTPIFLLLYMSGYLLNSMRYENSSNDI